MINEISIRKTDIIVLNLKSIVNNDVIIQLEQTFKKISDNVVITCGDGMDISILKLE